MDLEIKYVYYCFLKYNDEFRKTNMMYFTYQVKDVDKYFGSIGMDNTTVRYD